MKKLGAIALLLLGMVPAFAADDDSDEITTQEAMKGFSFSEAGSSDAQAQYWNDLMRYKVFAHQNIEMKSIVRMSDTVGFVGTATGDWIMDNNQHRIGGPILIANDIRFADGLDTLYSGPVRVLGTVTAVNVANYKNGENDLRVTQCIKGTPFEGYDEFVDKSKYYVGSNYRSCPSSVPAVGTHLSIPKYSGTTFDRSLVNVAADGGSQSIVVPEGKTVYDIHVTKISLMNGGDLYIDMPAGGRITRIFVDNFDKFNAGSSIRVRYKQADGSYKLVPNKSYTGNVLFYSLNKIVFDALDERDTLQGNFLSADEIHINQHMNLAGQLLAENIYIDAEFSGEFIYVPFNPSKVTAKGMGEMWENKGKQEMSITLSKTTISDVHLNYCFVFDGDNSKNRTNSTEAEANRASVEDLENTTGVPLCGSGSATLSISAGAISPSTKVMLPILFDNVDEYDEYFTFRVLSIDGAVVELPDGTTGLQGDLNVVIHDVPRSPKSKDTTFKAIEDNVFLFEKFPALTSGGAVLESYKVKIEKLPGQGTLTLAGVAVAEGDEISSESLTTLAYSAPQDKFGEAYATFKFRVIDGNGYKSDNAYTATIDVAPVNDAPVARDTTITFGEVSKTRKGVIPVNNIDVDDTEFTFSFDATNANYAKVNSLYTINSSTGVISVKSGKTLNYESTDSVLVIPVIVTDKASTTGGVGKLAGTSVVTIKIIDENENPVINPQTFKVDENSPNGKVVGTVVATDPDRSTVSFGKLTYSIPVNDDSNTSNDVPFAINTNTGVITVSDVTKLDYETSPTFNITVKVVDGGGKSATAVVTIDLNDLNEEPQWDDGKDIYEVFENTANTTVIAKIEIVDPDASDKADVNQFIAALADKKTSTADGRLRAQDLFGIAVAKDPSTGKIYTVISVTNQAKLNYEAIDTVFNVTLTLTNHAGATDAKTLTLDRQIKVKDENEKPAVANKTFNIKENPKVGSSVGTVTGTDPDTYNAVYSKLTYSLFDAAGFAGLSSSFKINRNTGAITVADSTQLNFEKYSSIKIGVQVVDGGNLKAAGTVTINISNINEKPEIGCKSGDSNCNGPFKVNENSKTGTPIHEFVVSDVDAGDLESVTASIKDNGSTGADSLFSVTLEGGILTIVVKDSVKLDYEKVNPAHEVVVTVIDAGGLTDTIIRIINVIDVNEEPTVADAEFTIEENLAVGDSVGVVQASDPDVKNSDYGTLYYSLFDDAATTPNASKWFDIDSNGKLTVKDNTHLNYEEDSVIVVKVRVTDKIYSDTATVTVHLSDVNEPPFIDPDDDPDIPPDDKKCVANCDEKPTDPDDPKIPTYEIKENVPTKTVVFAYVVKDVDAGDLAELTPTLKDNKGTGVDSLFDVVIEDLTDTSRRVVVFVRDSAKLNFENVEPSHNVTVIVKDPDGSADSLVCVINVVDVNEKPTVADAEFKIDENLAVGDSVGKVDASDPDVKNAAFGTLYYSLFDDPTTTPGASKWFDIDSNGKVAVKDNKHLNYEEDSVIVVKVRVTDKTYSDTATVTVHLNDVNETPKIIPDDDDDGDDDEKDRCVANCDNGDDEKGTPGSDKNLTVSVNENVPTGTPVIAYYVEDEDAGDVAQLVPSIVDNKKTGVDSLFTVDLQKEGDRYKVVVSVKDSAKLDYEKVERLHDLTIVVEDPDGSRDSVVRRIVVNDVNENPIVNKQEFVILEHTKSDTVLGKLEWDDIDLVEKFRDNVFSVIGGDSAEFAIAEDGTISAKHEFDYEIGWVDDSTWFGFGWEGAKDYTRRDTVFTLIVALTDRRDPTLKDTTEVVVHVHNVFEPPHLTTTELAVPENSKDSTKIGTLEGVDLDGPYTVFSYELADSSDYVYVAPNGDVFVKDSTLFDFENIKSFDIKVRIQDPDGSASVGTVTIKITDVNEAPKLDNTTFEVAEDADKGTVVDTVKAKDPDVNNPEFSKLTYALVGESDVFEVKPDGSIVVIGELDYETTPVYTIQVSVNDGEFTDTADVTIKVTNVVERSYVEITKAENSDTSWVKPDTIYTNKTELEVFWRECANEKRLENCNVQQETSTLKEGKNVIIKTYQDPTTDKPGADTLIVYYSNSAPTVTVSASVDAIKAKNIYSIVEQTDAADTNVYVNETKNEVTVTVKDPVTKTDTAFVIKVDLADTVTVPSNTYSMLSSIAESGVALNLDPESKVVRVPDNGNVVKVHYAEKVNGKSVVVHYMTDNDGEVLKTPVENSKGQVDSIEVITVSYDMTIGGKKVTVSYQADAITGAALYKDAEGNLMTASAAESNSKKVDAGMFSVTYEAESDGTALQVAYVVNEKGNLVKNATGDLGYSVSYTYVNVYGNASTGAVFIVLDQIGPKVEIISPVDGDIVYTNFINVVWTVNGVEQDSLNLQGLDKGANVIVRYYQDKAGNIAADTIFVVMKNAKDVAISIEKPVTILNADSVQKYYADNPPKEGQNFAVSLLNVKTQKEKETLIGGSFENKEGSGEEPYAGLGTHLGPTLGVDVKLPVISAVGGLATLDDLIDDDGLVFLEDVEAGEKMPVAEYVNEYCTEEFADSYDSDFSKNSLYKTVIKVKIWIYTSLGGFVDYFTFKQSLDDPDFVDESGLLKMYFEMKPDKNGDVRTISGRLYSTGAYVYKTEVEINSTLQCTLYPKKPNNDQQKGMKRKSSDELLKPFGYKRPEKR